MLCTAALLKYHKKGQCCFKKRLTCFVAISEVKSEGISCLFLAIPFSLLSQFPQTMPWDKEQSQFSSGCACVHTCADISLHTHRCIYRYIYRERYKQAGFIKALLWNKRALLQRENMDFYWNKQVHDGRWTVSTTLLIPTLRGLKLFQKIKRDFKSSLLTWIHDL